jgi:hypothetical protein
MRLCAAAQPARINPLRKRRIHHIQCAPGALTSGLPEPEHHPARTPAQQSGEPATTIEWIRRISAGVVAGTSLRRQPQAARSAILLGHRCLPLSRNRPERHLIPNPIKSGVPQSPPTYEKPFRPIRRASPCKRGLIAPEETPGLTTPPENWLFHHLNLISRSRRRQAFSHLPHIPFFPPPCAVTPLRPRDPARTFTQPAAYLI